MVALPAWLPAYLLGYLFTRDHRQCRRSWVFDEPVRAPTYPDEVILASLRAAASEAGEPLKVTAYDAWRRGGEHASSALVIRRFGSWIAACKRAGLATNTTRSTSSRWSDEDVLAFVAAYLSSSGGAGSYAGYVEWARENSGAPSGPTLRQRYPSWNELKARAARA